MSDWASVSRRSLVYAAVAVSLVVVSATLAVFGGSRGSLLSSAGQIGLVAGYAGAAAVTLWAALRHKTLSHRWAWVLVAGGLAVSMGSYTLSLGSSSATGTAALPGTWVTLLLIGSFVLFGSGFIMLALGMRHVPGAWKVLTASVLLSLGVALLVAVASFAPVGAGRSGPRQADWGVLLLVCLDTALLLVPALFSVLAASRTAGADSRASLCLVAGALIMILGDALYPLVNQSGESVLASVPWSLAVVLFGLGASLSADAAEAAEPHFDAS